MVTYRYFLFKLFIYAVTIFIIKITLKIETRKRKMVTTVKPLNIKPAKRFKPSFFNSLSPSPDPFWRHEMRE
jgi:hypothetical protein